VVQGGRRKREVDIISLWPIFTACGGRLRFVLLPNEGIRISELGVDARDITSGHDTRSNTATAFECSGNLALGDVC